jgi:transcriptional regulator with XRE-family HTH domain
MWSKFAPRLESDPTREQEPCRFPACCVAARGRPLAQRFRKKVQGERKIYLLKSSKPPVFKGFERARSLPQQVTRCRLNQKHGRSVSWGSWAGHACRGIAIQLVMPLHLIQSSSRGGPSPRSASHRLRGTPTPHATRDEENAKRAARDEREPQMDSLGSRLRYERERRQISLKSIAESTKIGMTLLEGLERDDVSRWPSGIFRRSFIRSYAEAIGLRPDSVVREFVELYPDPLETQLAAIPAAPRPPQSNPVEVHPAEVRSSSTAPLAIKLTITWSGSVHHTIVRLADWKIVRLLLDWRSETDGFKSQRI